MPYLVDISGEACPFLKGKGGVGWERGEVGGVWKRGGRGNCSQNVICKRRIN